MSDVNEETLALAEMRQKVTEATKLSALKNEVIDRLRQKEGEVAKLKLEYGHTCELVVEAWAEANRAFNKYADAIKEEGA